MNKQNNKINYIFDSKEEEYFYTWLLELYNIGYIDWIYPNKKTYRVINETLSTRMAKLKTKGKYKLFILTKKSMADILLRLKSHSNTLRTS